MPRPRLTDEQLDAEALHILKQHVGRKNPIGRWELVAKIFGPVAPQYQNDSNVADRQVRDAVKRLRNQGVLICDMGDGLGRYLAETLEEYQAFRLRYGSRAYEVLETLREMDKSAEREFGNILQPRLI
ncbi:hypothetical protein FBQ81_03405 [Chloroflexi bacterium CFX6]|nr:hypothetical protein [Chloroflexi bacterium CFX6]